MGLPISAEQYLEYQKILWELEDKQLDLLLLRRELRKGCIQNNTSTIGLDLADLEKRIRNNTELITFCEKRMR